MDDTAQPGKLPAGWYQLKIGGAFDERDAQPGSYCCSECLAVAVMHTYGMPAGDVRLWLRGKLNQRQA